MSVRGTSIAIMDKGASSGYKDASSSQEREMQSAWKMRKLRAELEEAEQATKDDLTKEAKTRRQETRRRRSRRQRTEAPGERQARLKKGAAGEATRQRRMGTTRRRRATKELRVRAAKFHPRREGRAQSRSGRLSRRWREVERRMNVLELGGKYHDRYGEKSMHAQREAQSTMGEPSRGVVLDGSLGEPETVRPRVAASAKRTTGLPDSGSTRLGCRG